MAGQRIPSLLIVANENALAKGLNSENILAQVSGAAEAIDVVAKQELGLLLIEMNVSGDIEELVEEALRADQDTQVLCLASEKESELALRCLKAGAAEILPRPCDPARLAAALDRAGLLWRYRRELRRWKAPSDEASEAELLGGSALIRSLRDRVSKLASHDATVLIHGEAGTGKSSVARYVHAHSLRARERFVTLDCTGLPAEDIESALFGVEGSAALGALGAAAAGTLYLRNVEGLPGPAQAHLLRALKEKEFDRVGGKRLQKCDARVVSATRRDLLALVHQGKFREDLYWALCGVSLGVPSLRERAADIEELFSAFLERASHRLGKKVPSIPQGLLSKITSHSFPGNVAELRDLAGVMAALSEGELNLAALPSQLLAPLQNGRIQAEGSLALKPAVHEFEKQYLMRVLKSLGGNQSKAARVLDIHRNTLILKMQELGIPNRKERVEGN